MSLGTQAKPYGKLLDYEQFIDHQIQRTRMRIKVTDIITASLTLVVGFLAVLFLEVIFDHVFGLPLFLRRRDPGDRADGCLRVCSHARRNAIHAANQRDLRGQDDRERRRVVQEQPDQLPRAARKSGPVVEGDHGDSGSAGRQRSGARRGRHGREPAAFDADFLRALGGDRGLLPVRGLHAQEHSRLDPASVSGRSDPAHQHAAREHQAGDRPRAVEGRRRRARALFRRRAGNFAPTASCCISASTAASFTPSASLPPATIPTIRGCIRSQTCSKAWTIT